METDNAFVDENLICRRIDFDSGHDGLADAINCSKTDTINVLQVIDWYPYVGVWLITKEISNYTLENISLKITCPSDSVSTSSTVSIIESNVVLSEIPNYPKSRLWFATFASSFPFLLEINTFEKIMENTELSKISSTSREMFIHSFGGILGRKTYFDVPSPHITYNNIDFYGGTQIEHGIYFFISLGYYCEIIPLDRTIRGILNSVILSDKRFSGDITFPWNWGELISSEHQTYIFIPPIEEDDTESIIPLSLFGNVPYTYKGALIMSSDSHSVKEARNILIGTIKDASPPSYEFIKNYYDSDD